jgi:hypothetical protein
VLESTVADCVRQLSAGENTREVLDTLKDIAATLRRLAEVYAPEPSDIVGTGYIQRKLGFTTPVYVAELARKGSIPKACIVPGTGNGKLWKFRRKPVDQWLESR